MDKYITYVEPDISVICDPNKINKKGCKGATDWILEITSPINSSHDYITKLNLYKIRESQRILDCKSYKKKCSCVFF